MDHRRTLATLAAVVCSGTALAVAVGATARVFDAAEASPGVGQVSPVHPTHGPPIVERHVIDVVDPPTTPPAGVVPTTPTTAAPRHREPTPTPTIATTPAPAAATPPATTARPVHEFERDDD